MPETTQELKVYELAKELGLDSFALLDKLKQIDIEVKSHMSSLAAEQAEKVRQLLKSENKKGPDTTKKRAAAPKATTKKAATAAAPAEKKEAAAPAAAKTTATPTAAAAAKRKVIKRRSGSEDEAESNEQNESGVAREGSAESDDQSAMAADAPEAVQEAPSRASQLGTRANLRTPNDRVVEKDELLDEFTTRRLKIVKAASPEDIAASRDARPTYRTPGGPSGEKKRGPVAPQPAAAAKPKEEAGMFQPYTSVVKDEETKKRGGAGVATKKIEDVRISDFRKREMVFQPKRKKLPPGKQIKRTEITTPGAHKRKIKIEDKITVGDLAQRMGEKSNTIIQKLMALGSMVTVNQTIDFDTATLIATEFGYEVENVAFREDAMLKVDQSDEDLILRPPVITVMGHVDHGKTSLLDAIRNAKVVEGEAGGITQHIGAYSVTVEGSPITFLDTPGHAAFANMRARGANLTDIVVLVVAADDSIMPQPIEAIQHATAAKVPIIVAANKMDKPAANIEKVKKDLSQHGVLVEEWGGQVPLVPVSATKKTGLDNLLATIKVQAEVLELKANPTRPAEGVILESRMEKGKGVVTDVLVKQGTLTAGDYIVVGTAYGRVRAITNDRGQQVNKVLPGFPAEIIGLNDVPSAGDFFNVTPAEEDAREIAENRKKKINEQKAADLAPKPMTLDELMAKIPVPGLKELNIVVKADVYGSAEAIKQSIEKIESDKIKAKVIVCSVGVITENDVILAKAANAIILGFNAKPDSKARESAKREKVVIKHYDIIYQLLDDVRLEMENLLEPLRKETYVGRAEVKQTFAVSKIGTIAGSTVVDGKIQRNAFAKVKRGKDVVHEGKVVSLKRFKDDASETIKGQECGIGVENFETYLPGDLIEVFHVEFVKQTL
jgi:translation initiation factor IF-2